ncbi:MAG: sensor histidine kinase [Lachnospiraceae bacterium]
MYTLNGGLVTISRTKRRFRFFKSLRLRIALFLVVIGILPSIAVTGIIIATYEDRAVSVRASNIRNQFDIISNRLIEEDFMNDQSSELINEEIELLANVFSGRILLIDTDFKVIKDTYNLDFGKMVVSEDVLKCFNGSPTNDYDSKNQLLELTIPIQVPKSDTIQGVMLMSISTSEITASIAVLEQKGTLIVAIIAALVVVLGYLLASVLVKPFSKITRQIENITDGIQQEDVAVSDYLETELITDAFNAMWARTKVLDDSRQEFVSNVSHELKTPLTSVKVLADSLIDQDDVPVEVYKEFMIDITQEIDRENKIITDLLALVKLDKKAADLNIEHKNINELLESILKRLRPIADKRNIDIILDSFRPVEADVDEVKFTLAISNLVENGVKYNVDDGWVRISLDADHKYFYVTVADSGMGIPEESLDQVFERFYRADKSHSKEIGGTGLGLAITKDAITMHRGAIKVQSKEDEGTTFSVRIPLTFVP